MNEGGFDSGMDSGTMDSSPSMDVPADNGAAFEGVEAPTEAIETPNEGMDPPPEVAETIDATAAETQTESLEMPPETGSLDAEDAQTEGLEPPPEAESVEGAEDVISNEDLESAPEAIPDSDGLFEPMPEIAETAPEADLESSPDVILLEDLETAPEAIPDSDELFEPMPETAEAAPEADLESSPDVIPLEDLETAPEAIPDSDELFEPMPETAEAAPEADLESSPDVIPLEDLEAAPEAIPDSDGLFDPMPETAEAAPETDLEMGQGTSDSSTELLGEQEENLNSTSMAHDEKPDYSFSWNGYETHERPEESGPGLSRGYHTTPDDSFHPSTISGESLENETSEGAIPEVTDYQADSINEVTAPESRTGETETIEEILRDLPEALGEEGTRSEQDDLAGILEQMQQDYPDIVNHETRNLSREIRAARSPSEITGDGELKGSWEDGAFVLDDSYVPGEKFNPEHKTIGEIKADLKETYGIELDRIPFADDEADFSSLSVAHLDSDEIAQARLGMSAEGWDELGERDRVEKRAEVFEKRSPNFSMADRLAAERGIEIPTLGNNYTATELAEWRQKNHFTWDEQLGKGYNLVPSVIHNNIAHTGLVSHSTNAKKALNDYDAHENEHFWNEEDAPITLQEAIDKLNGQ